VVVQEPGKTREYGGTITLYNTQMREDFRSSTSEFRKVGTDRFDPLNSGRHLGAPVCTLLMNYVGCIITEPHIFSSVSDAPVGLLGWQSQKLL